MKLASVQVNGFSDFSFAERSGRAVSLHALVGGRA